MPRTLTEQEFNAIKDKILEAAPSGLKEEDFNRYAGPAMEQAIGQAENSAAPVEGSAIARLAAGAWKNLNPMSIVNAIAHPIDTLDSLTEALAAEKDKARQAAKEGRYSEAFGHAVASAIPVLGPSAAHAGERIASGDVAGGLGEGAGMLAGVESPRLAAALPLRAAARAGATVLEGVPTIRRAVPLAEPLAEGLRKLGTPPNPNDIPLYKQMESLPTQSPAPVVTRGPAPPYQPQSVAQTLSSVDLAKAVREGKLSFKDFEALSKGTPPTSVAEAINQTASVAKAAKIKLTLAESLEASKLYLSGMSKDEAINSVLKSRSGSE